MRTDEDMKVALSIAETMGATRVFPLTLSSGFSTFGLAKRELFAAMAMQGLLSIASNGANIEQNVSDAVKHADMLMAELDKPK